jgi:hypothetical protein
MPIRGVPLSVRTNKNCCCYFCIQETRRHDREKMGTNVLDQGSTSLSRKVPIVLNDVGVLTLSSVLEPAPCSHEDRGSNRPAHL